VARSWITALLFVDGAGNRRSGDLNFPDNVMLPCVPTFPELNPRENVPNEIREKIFIASGGQEGGMTT
jgi:hypothetical protein